MALRSSFDLIVCGGGVIGLSIAVQCAMKGWRVCVLDAGTLGKGSSWAGAGILPAGATIPAEDPIEQLRALSHSLYPEWSKRLQELTGIDNEYRRSGGIYLGRTPAEQATLAANRLWWDEHGIAYQRLSRQELLERVPILADSPTLTDFMHAWWLPDDCRVRNPRHIKALGVACHKLGITVLENQAVVDFRENQPWIVVTTNNSYQARNVCLTSGAWTVKLLERLKVESGIMPVRGQMVLYKLPKMRFACVVNEGHRYLVPRDDGHVLAGSCEEEVGFLNETTEDKLGEIKDWAVGLCPILTSCPIVKTWAGLRPGSFDTYPYLGPIPGRPGLFIAAGHFRHGLHWSTGTALLMQQSLFGEKTAIAMEPFQLLRDMSTLSV